jgi:hypothetical protein
VDETVSPDDIYIHPGIDPNDAWEWITRKPEYRRLIG